MITIKSITPGFLNVSSSVDENLNKDVRLNPGNMATVITSGGALIRILNDIGGPVTFSPIQLGDATISQNASELSIPESPDFLYISQFGEKLTI